MMQDATLLNLGFVKDQKMESTPQKHQQLTLQVMIKNINFLLNKKIFLNVF